MKREVPKRGFRPPEISFPGALLLDNGNRAFQMYMARNTCLAVRYR